MAFLCCVLARFYTRLSKRVFRRKVSKRPHVVVSASRFLLKLPAAKNMSAVSASSQNMATVHPCVCALALESQAACEMTLPIVY
jgi:hypothetical protein